jgi:branched-chain amino acid transport system substrate-binding protein
LSKVLAPVWASGEHDIMGAGGWAVAEGYYTMSFAGVGDDYPVRHEIRAMLKTQGREPSKAMDDTVMYNRGLLWAAVHVEATRNAIKSNGGRQPTGEDVKKGFEQIQDFGLGGLVPPLKVTAADHEGGGWVQVFQVKGGKFVKQTEWFRGYPELVAQTVAKAE